MSRQKHYLTLSDTKDRDLVNLLNNCRHCRLDQLKEYSSQNRINSYLREWLLEKIATQQGDIYRLTEKGYRQIEREIGLENMRYHSQSITHDLKLADYYIQVHREHSNVTWRNEEDLKSMKRDMMEQLREQGRFIEMDRLSNMSVTDCVVSVDEITYGYDVITDNYSNLDIQLKEEFCETLQIELKIERC